MPERMRSETDRLTTVGYSPTSADYTKYKPNKGLSTQYVDDQSADKVIYHANIVDHILHERYCRTHTTKAGIHN